jgi:hypothetical protein
MGKSQGFLNREGAKTPRNAKKSKMDKSPFDVCLYVKDTNKGGHRNTFANLCVSASLR